MQVIIGVDPHKASHTAVAISAGEDELARKKVRATRTQVDQLLAWAEPFPTRTWAIEGADGLGYLLAQQLVAAGEHVRQRAGHAGGADPAAGHGPDEQERPQRRPVGRDHRAADPRVCDRSDAVGHSEVLRLLAKRNIDIGDQRTRLVCRMHALLVELAAGGIAKEINASDVDRFLAEVTPATPAEQVRYDLAVELLDDIRRLDAQLKASHKRIRAAVAASGTTLTDIFGVGPIIAAMLIGYTGDIARFREPRPLRRLQRHRPGRVLLRRPHRPPPLPTREPQPQPRPPHGRHLPAPPTPLRRPRLLRPTRRRGQDQQGSPPRAEAPHQQRRLPPPRRRRRTRPRLTAGPGGQAGTTRSQRDRPYIPDDRLFGKVTPGPTTNATTTTPPRRLARAQTPQTSP